MACGGFNLLSGKSALAIAMLAIAVSCGGGGGGGSGSPVSGSYSHVWVGALNNGGQVVLRMNTSSSNSYYGVIEITGAGSCMDGSYTNGVLAFTQISDYYRADTNGADGTAASVTLSGTYDPQTLTIQGGLQVQRSGAGFGGSPYCDPQYNLVIALQ